MDFFKVTSFENAKKAIQDAISIDNLDILQLSLYDAIGYRTAEDISSDEDLPDYARSTVDGYAVKALNTYGATDSTPAIFKIIGKGEMGVIPDVTVRAGEAFYVPTGGGIPKGADAMVMIEHTEPFGGDVAIYRPSAVNENIIGVGDDVKKGASILKKGEKITPLNAGVLAAIGKSTVSVYRLIKIAIVSTGDEIIEIDRQKSKGEIRDTNTILEKSLCEENGFEVSYASRIKDGFDLLNREVAVAKERADIVLISGGSSIGSRDYTEQVLSSQGDILVHGISLKPGKPTIIAKLGEKLAVGLPGHPMACLLVLKLLVLSSVNEMFQAEMQPFVYAKTTINFPSQPGRTTVQPVSLSYGEDGVCATPLFYKSGLISVIARADGYILIPCNAEGVTKNQTVKIYLL